MIVRRFRSRFRKQHGVSAITAIFLLLLFAGLAALMANMISTSHATSAADVLSARAYQAARAGVEWGLYKVLEDPDPDHTEIIPGAGACLSAVVLPSCPQPEDFPLPNLEGFDMHFNCEQFPPDDSSDDYYQEGCRRVRIFRLTATARGPGPAGLTIEREVQVVAEKCRDASGAAAPYDC